MDSEQGFATTRRILGLIAQSDKMPEYCGLPVPIPGEQLILEPRHPAAAVYAQIDAKQANAYGEARSFACSHSDVNEETTLVNVFYSHKARCEIVIYRVGDKTEWGKIPALNHITHDFSTMACSVAWGLDAELKAMDTLCGLIPRHLFKMYFLSGMFMETSKRSGVTYVFRRLRPTIALRPHPHRDEMRILTALCLHPIGYYGESWAGAMCPTDDVMSHLLLMRADEHYFWKKANQIPPHKPNAGL